MATLTQKSPYQPDWLRSETGPRESTRQRITILAGAGSARALTTGMVLGRIAAGTATQSTKAGNTGNGTLTLDPSQPVQPWAQTGRYRLTATGATNFQVFDPAGRMLGNVTVGGTAFATQIRLTMTAGGTAFAAGDEFYVDVVVTGGKWVQLDLAGTDGRQFAQGILVEDATAPDGTDGVGTALVRSATIVSSQLTWPAGITTTQRNIAIGYLQGLGIIDSAAA